MMIVKHLWTLFLEQNIFNGKILFNESIIFITFIYIVDEINGKTNNLKQ